MGDVAGAAGGAASNPLCVTSPEGTQSLYESGCTDGRMLIGQYLTMKKTPTASAGYRNYFLLWSVAEFDVEGKHTGLVHVSSFLVYTNKKHGV